MTRKGIACCLHPVYTWELWIAYEMNMPEEHAQQRDVSLWFFHRAQGMSKTE